MKTISRKHPNVWPIYTKNPTKDVSSFALTAILAGRLDKEKFRFQVERLVEINNYSYCPITKVYLNHKSFNSGAESHFFYHDGIVIGSIVVGIANDQISNWRSELLKARVIEYLKYSLKPLDVVHNKDPFLFNDNYSLKAGFSLHMETEGDEYKLFIVNVYLDLSHEVGEILLKF